MYKAERHPGHVSVVVRTIPLFHYTAIPVRPHPFPVQNPEVAASLRNQSL